MKIGLARDENEWIIGKTALGSGDENMCYVLGGRWYDIKTIYNEEFDVVLYNAFPDALDRLIELGKSPKWKKLVLCQEAGHSLPNSWQYLDKMLQCNFDAVLLKSRRLRDQYALLGIPITEICVPYPFNRDEVRRCRTIEKSRKVGLNINRAEQTACNFSSTLAVFSKLPADVQGIAFVSEDMVDNIRRVIGRLGLHDRITIDRFVSWEDYIRMVADCCLFISMDARATWGRFVLDAAGVGSRCVGAYSECQSRIFPELMVDDFQIDKAASLCLRELEAGRPYCLPEEIIEMFSHQSFLNDIHEKFHALWGY